MSSFKCGQGVAFEFRNGVGELAFVGDGLEATALHNLGEVHNAKIKTVLLSAV